MALDLGLEGRVSGVVGGTHVLCTGHMYRTYVHGRYMDRHVDTWPRSQVASSVSCAAPSRPMPGWAGGCRMRSACWATAVQRCVRAGVASMCVCM